MVDVSWTAGNVRLCPVRVVFGTVAEVSPCAETNIGVLRAARRIPLAIANLKMIPVTCVPLGKEIVDNDRIPYGSRPV